MDPSANPFAVLSLIGAPAVLTNACALLTMSTSNRLARAVDRARALAKQLEETPDISTPEAARRLGELSASERRGVMRVNALRSFYLALAGFAAATLVSLLGAVFVAQRVESMVRIVEIVALAAGVAAVAALIHGAWQLVLETRIALGVVRRRAAAVRARVGNAVPPTP